MTKRKLLFVEDRNQEAALMAEKFNMDLMEECLGGRSTQQFDFESYGADMRCVVLLQLLSVYDGSQMLSP